MGLSKNEEDDEEELKSKLEKKDLEEKERGVSTWEEAKKKEGRW